VITLVLAMMVAQADVIDDPAVSGSVLFEDNDEVPTRAPRSTQAPPMVQKLPAPELPVVTPLALSDRLLMHGVAFAVAAPMAAVAIALLGVYGLSPLILVTVGTLLIIAPVVTGLLTTLAGNAITGDQRHFLRPMAAGFAIYIAVILSAYPCFYVGVCGAILCLATGFPLSPLLIVQAMIGFVAVVDITLVVSAWESAQNVPPAQAF
jgi:hypothetical protein